MKTEVLLFTGPIRSGKTTTLMNWCKNRSSISGLLAPDLSGLRFLYDITSKAYIPFQSQEPADNTVSIGRFHFFREGFQQAHRIIHDSLLSYPDFIIIDEIGPLELKGQGYEPACTELMKRLENESPRTKLILVVREHLVKEVCEKFGLVKACCIDQSYFDNGL